MRHHNPALACLAVAAASAALGGDAGPGRWRAVLEADGVSDPRILEAMEQVRRRDFLPEDQRPHELEDRPLPIGHGQTTSQPSLIARMIQELQLKPGCNVLEVGTGSGYQTALLARLCARVYSIDIVAPLADSARQRLAAAGVAHATVRAGDGYAGWPEHAPFDGIVVSAAAPRVPPPLVEQLKPGARMIVPVEGDEEKLFIVTRAADGGSVVEESIAVRFVPLTGDRADKDRERR